MDEFDKELLTVFREEVAQALDELAGLIESLPGLDAEASREAIRAAFRAAHNVKGAARTVGLETFEQLAHAIEDALAVYREGGQEVPAPLATCILAGVTVLERLAGGEEADGDAERCAADIRSGGGPPPPSAAPTTPEEDRPEADVAGPAESAPARDAAARAPAPGGAESGAATVRVEVDRLDRVMAHVGELLVAHARQTQRHHELGELERSFEDALRRLSGQARNLLAPVAKRLEAVCNIESRDLAQFGYLTDEIGDSMKQLRMLPLRNLAAPWRSIVREAAMATGRQVQLDVRVGDLEVDKHVLDALRDPMMHLLRNAVGHGIEDSEARRQAGKEERGRIVIDAAMRGVMVEICVSDDGRGVDVDKVRRRAVELGLVDAAQLADLSEEEVLDLVFEAGLSTTDSVDRLSGRGVGLDVVRQRLIALGGHVRVAPHCSLGGAEFRVTVPVSLVSSRTLLVRAGGLVYAIAIERVARTLRVESREIRQVEGAAAVRLDAEKPLRLRWLASLMGRKRGVDEGVVTVVVVSRGTRLLGLVVDEILGVDEFVTKPLPWNLREVPGASSAIILGDGSLAVVVDVGYLLEGTAARSGEASDTVQRPRDRERRRVLVVDDSLTSRTLERNILLAVGFEVEVATNGLEGWEKVQEFGPDLVVVDVEMPEMNGLELTRRIRQDARFAQLPVILVTSLDGREDRIAGADAGADEYIVKGDFDQRQLLEAVERLI